MEVYELVKPCWAFMMAPQLTEKVQEAYAALKATLKRGSWLRIICRQGGSHRVGAGSQRGRSARRVANAGGDSPFPIFAARNL